MLLAFLDSYKHPFCFFINASAKQSPSCQISVPKQRIHKGKIKVFLKSNSDNKPLSSRFKAETKEAKSIFRFLAAEKGNVLEDAGALIW
jgi:hypothetical protein